MMKRTLITLALIGLMAAPAQAGCFADYKAKRDNPLQLHYGVIELPDTGCGSPEEAAAQIIPRIETDGWTLLNVLSVFDQDGMDQRRESAGEYFLRY